MGIGVPLMSVLLPNLDLRFGFAVSFLLLGPLET
jgi:hypothetical protein